MKLKLWMPANRFGVEKEWVTGVVRGLKKLKQRQETVGMSVSVVGEAKMRQLNQQYMGRSGVTDVLSFPLKEGVGADGVMRLGDVVICYPQAVKQAKENQLTIKQELKRLLEHGLRHLVGEHH